MIISEKEIGKLGSPEEQDLEGSPMDEFRQRSLIVPESLQKERIDTLEKAAKPKAKKKNGEKGYKPGKQITLEL